MGREEWKRIGGILSERRIGLSYTRENIFELTHISIENIKLIEEGNLGLIPQVYMIDFLNRYSRILSLNSREILALYESGLAENGERHFAAKKKRRHDFKPLTLVNFFLLPVLFTVMILQFIRISDIAGTKTPRITNEGVQTVEIEYYGSKRELKAGESFAFADDVRLKVINPSENRIVVKYNNKLWNVSLKEFEVYISDG